MKASLFVLPAMIVILAIAFPLRLCAHCDTMEGPVVAAAKLALEKGEVTPVLKWIKAQNEEEIRTAFAKTLAVRKQSAEAKELADMYFFETLVRVHRAGEGEPYIGLKPAGTEVEPGIAAADKAVESGNVDGLVRELAETVAASIRKRHQRVTETRKHSDESVEDGREYVEAYVEFIHYVERLHETVAAKPGAHAAETKPHEHTK